MLAGHKLSGERSSRDKDRTRDSWKEDNWKDRDEDRDGGHGHRSGLNLHLYVYQRYVGRKQRNPYLMLPEKIQMAERDNQRTLREVTM